MDEIWKTLLEFPDYAVSDKGRVRRIVPSPKGHGCRILKPHIGTHGYEMVGLSFMSKIHKRLVHRLVCAAFHGAPPSDFHQVGHRDGSRRFNYAGNLRWVTRSENMEDARMHGSMALGKRHGRSTKPECNPRGCLHGHAKLTEPDVIKIRSAHQETGRSLAKKYGVSPATISIIRSRKTWRHI